MSKQKDLIQQRLRRVVVKNPLGSLQPYVSCGFCVRTDVAPIGLDPAADLYASGWRMVEERMEDGSIRNTGTYHLACDRCAPLHQVMEEDDERN